MNDIRVIHLENGGFTIVDADLFPVLSQYKWYRDKRGYVSRYANQPSESRRHVSLARTVNQTPEGLCTDHINGCVFDNTRRNLRTATKSQNNMNRGKATSRKGFASPYRGVSLHKKSGLWHSRLRVEGKEISLGYFKTQEAAAHAFNEGAKQHFGEFAKLNDVGISQEQANELEPKYSSKYRGVVYLAHDKRHRVNMWRCRVQSNGKDTESYHMTELEAAKAYNALALQLHGEKAILNKIVD